MQHSYEGLDRGGGFSRARILAPFAHRDYRLLWGGMCVSLLGDGMFLVALTWQVYALSNAPAALATVGMAMTMPTIGCLLLGQRSFRSTPGHAVRRRGAGSCRRRSRRSGGNRIPPPLASVGPGGHLRSGDRVLRSVLRRHRA